MNKKKFLILIAISAILTVRATNNLTVHANQLAFPNKAQALSKLQLTCVFDTINFINETEDDINESKFQSHINHSCVLNYIQYKVLPKIRLFPANTLYVCDTSLYHGISMYLAIGNQRI